ncbi:hypothetical protein RJ639_012407 [Escallonia herrerae]|uniref:Uncharacterized protein n=1 Tax=Escallonia herrerae TaxID=1293975 RepID=A0AA88VPR1_9ASTE|nr:hypothetical protein RJ639_012407 [Escallonia herrerae]
MGFTDGHKLAVSMFLMLLVLVFSFSQIAAQTSSPDSLESGRNLTEADDTVRVDPLDNLKKYRGGYDITNKHYWSSTIFTGIHGYVIGMLWLLCGLLYAGFHLATTFCCNGKNRKMKHRYPCQMQCYLWPILLAIFFTVLAITGCGLVLGGNAKFRLRAQTVVDIIIDTANEASETIYNTTGAMKDMSTNLVATNGDGQASSFLTSTSERLDFQAAGIQRQAKKNRDAIDKGLKIVYSDYIDFFVELGCCDCHVRFIVLCWLLTVLCWLFFGMYFFIDKFAGDTCTALEEFKQDPYNNSLSSILPCDELLSAKSVLSDVSAGVYNLVDEVNANLTNRQADSYFHICNPFSAPPDYIYQPENCPTNAIQIGDIPQVLKLITCIDSSNVTCNGGIAISNSDFERVEAYTTSIQTLLNAYPGMESLVECQTVKDAFSKILQKHCKPLKRGARMVWAGLVFLSTVMVALVLIWITEAHHEQKHHSSDGSVKPHFPTAATMESGTTMANNDPTS